MLEFAHLSQRREILDLAPFEVEPLQLAQAGQRREVFGRRPLEVEPLQLRQVCQRRKILDPRVTQVEPFQVRQVRQGREILDSCPAQTQTTQLFQPPERVQAGKLDLHPFHPFSLPPSSGRVVEHELTLALNHWVVPKPQHFQVVQFPKCGGQVPQRQITQVESLRAGFLRFRDSPLGLGNDLLLRGPFPASPHRPLAPLIGAPKAAGVGSL